MAKEEDTQFALGSIGRLIGPGSARHQAEASHRSTDFGDRRWPARHALAASPTLGFDAFSHARTDGLPLL
jgi:hypothetical protein